MSNHRDGDDEKNIKVSKYMENIENTKESFNKNEQVANTESNHAQFQQVPVQTSQIVTNQVTVPNNATYQLENEIGPNIVRVPTQKSTNILCPYCGIKVDTVTENKFNICTLLCRIICFCGIPFILCAGEDIGCYDSTHKCPYCGRVIAQSFLTMENMLYVKEKNKNKK